MRRYETVIITDPELSEDQRKPLIQRLEDLIPQQDGLLITTDEWGLKRLAYKIKKKGRGYYVRFDYCGLAPLVNEIERFFRIDDRVLKYMTVLLNGDVDLEKIIAEKAAREAAAEKAEMEAHATQKTDELDTSPQDEPEKELAPAEEKAKIDEDLPSLEADDASAEKAPTSMKEEA